MSREGGISSVSPGAPHVECSQRRVLMCAAATPFRGDGMMCSLGGLTRLWALPFVRFNSFPVIFVSCIIFFLYLLQDSTQETGR